MLEFVKEYRQISQRLTKAIRSDNGASQARMEAFEQTAGQRLFRALELLHVQGMEKRLVEAVAWRQETAKLLPAVQILDGQLEATNRAGKMCAGLEKLLNEVMDHQGDEALINRILKKSREAERHLKE